MDNMGYGKRFNICVIGVMGEERENSRRDI